MEKAYLTKRDAWISSSIWYTFPMKFIFFLLRSRFCSPSLFLPFSCSIFDLLSSTRSRSRFFVFLFLSLFLFSFWHWFTLPPPVRHHLLFSVYRFVFSAEFVSCSLECYSICFLSFHCVSRSVAVTLIALCALSIVSDSP